MDSIHVRAPSPIIFLCGGQTDARNIKPTSLREAFTHIYNVPELRSYNTIMPEDFRIFHPYGQYTDILSFETEFAEIVDLVVLFSESNGSFTELGAFSMMKEIADRLLVVIDDENYAANSFIRLGPILYLQNNIGESSVCVINRSDLNINSVRDVSNLDLSVFQKRIVAAIEARKNQFREPTTLNRSRPGHIIKLIVGIVQHYSALKFDEIELMLAGFDVFPGQIKLADYLLCAINAGWIIKDRRGFTEYYCAIPNKMNAIEYELRKDKHVEPRERWRVQISQFWKENDDARFSVIQSVLKSALT